MTDTNPPSSVRMGIGLTALGISGAVATALMGVYYAPMVDSTAFNAPEAYRILYWHVPFAWSSFLAFCMLFIGAVAWYKDRSDWGWRWFSTGSDLGLLFGLGVITSGPIWGSAEWGVPWDWGDLRLNTFALLTGVALFLVLSLRQDSHILSVVKGGVAPQTMQNSPSDMSLPSNAPILTVRRVPND